ncbi:transposase [Komagataeibacter rhaeticus DSM 16663]|nr:transposase [Komagataeibacter rhaeticus DSM 16663]
MYDTDLTDQQWELLEPYIFKAKPGGRPRSTNVREVINAIFYVLKNGCMWRSLPRDFPPWQTVYRYFRHLGTSKEVVPIFRTGR